MLVPVLVFELLHTYVKVPVPPLAVTLAVPVAAPLHNTFTPVHVALTAVAGCKIVALTVAVHPLASVTVTVYVPAARPVRSSVVTVLPPLHT